METGQRPALLVPRSRMEKAIEIIAALGIIFNILTAFQAWPHLPARIPSHFGLFGEPDGWGGKGTLLVATMVNLVLYASLTVMSFYPHIYNFPWRITAENAERQYRLARSLAGMIKAEFAWLFALGNWKTIQVALGRASGLGLAFLPAFLTIIFGTIALYTYKAFRQR